MKIDAKDVAARASVLASQRNLTDREASIDASGKPDLIRDMKRGRMPSSDRLDALAVTLGTTTDYLLGKSASSTIPGSPGMATAEMERLPLDIPVYGTALGADLPVEDGGTAVEVEQTIIEMTEVVDHFRRLPGIANDREAYGLMVVGNSMSPRYDDGDPIYCTTKRQPAIGDYVVLQVKDGDHGTEIVSALIKKLIGRTATHYELEQFNPPLRFKISKAQVGRIHRVISPRELAGI